MNKPLFYRLYSAILVVTLVLLSALVSAPLAAQSTERVTLDPKQAPFDLAQYARVLIENDTPEYDWESRLRLPALVALDETEFTPVSTRKIGFGWNEFIVHVRIPVENTTNNDQEWTLSFNQTKWGHRTVNLVIDDAPIPNQPLFVFSPDVPWQDSDRILYTTFEMPAQSKGVLFVSYVNPASSAPMTIEVSEDYQHRRLVEDLTVYVLLGLVVGVTLLTVSLIGVLHQRVALYYAGYVACATMHLCFILDLFHPSPLLSVLTRPLHSFFWWAGISLLFYMLFQRAFFANDARIGNIIRNILLVAIVIDAALLLAHGFLQMPFNYYIFWSSLCILLVAANGIVAIVRKITGRWFFALGCVSITFMVAPITISDFMTAHYTYEEAAMIFLYGLALEAIALSCAMFMKVREIRAQREEALVSELRLTQDKLEASRRLAAAAHDIQQPLSSLRMALTSADKNAERSGEIDQAIDYLDEIVRTQMAETKRELTHHENPDDSNTEEFEVDVIFKNLQSMFADEADAKGLSLRVASTSKRAQTSPLGLMRILSNLVSNAIKNTQTGGVLVGCRQDETHVRIDVCDTGLGLTPEECEDLQEPYRRSGDYDGQGLGLSIVRQLCEEYSLTFRVSSKPDQGTVFHVLIPKPQS